MKSILLKKSAMSLVQPAPAPANVIGLNIDRDTGDVMLTTDADGFPILPAQWLQDCVKKATLERLWTAYIGLHYGM
jgi:hypothetical protein